MRKLIKIIVRSAFTLLFRVRMEGEITSLDSKRLLIIANH